MPADAAIVLVHILNPYGMAWLRRFNENNVDYQLDWADACRAVLCGRERDAKVWTYDREFRTTWRRPDGTAIPLAVRSFQIQRSATLSPATTRFAPTHPF
jgi:hypothetical protein